jgi:hypothetical protein
MSDFSFAAPRMRTMKPGGDTVALHHSFQEWDTFSEAAAVLHAIVEEAAAQFPGRPRHLYLDVEGHRNPAGGFDRDAYELMAHFVPRALMRYLDEARTPLCVFSNPEPSDATACARQIRKAS